MPRALLLMVAMLLFGCAENPNRETIGQLRNVEPDLSESDVDGSLVKALESYREFLNQTPEHAMAPEAMRRLADLQIERQYGILGDGVATVAVATETTLAGESGDSSSSGEHESDAAFEERTTSRRLALLGDPLDAADLVGGSEAMDVSSPMQAIATYQKILKEYPWYERNDQVLYQMARAYDELTQSEAAMQVIDRLIAQYPDSDYVDEVHFRRGEYNFVRRKYLDAENAYLAVVEIGKTSSFYELALYKLGWALYKQEFYEEALHQYMALLDDKLANGYDFDAQYGETEVEDERRVADTFRVVSLSFSNLGGADVLNEYFSENGRRPFEAGIYRNLAEFHLSKRRFTDAAGVYGAFVELNPLHKVAPHFSMRVSEIYAEGNFPILVVESKRDFATRYGTNAEYWQFFDIEAKPDVLGYLKTNLIDLANHYHALYQQVEPEEQRPANYQEALHWYGEFLASFADDEVSSSINYQLADLLLEHGDFEASAEAYERTAYGYADHDRAPAAGYAAIYSHREHLKVVSGAGAPAAKRATVDSSLRFAETFPNHENAATVLGAATEDLYAMQDFEGAIAAGRWLIDTHAGADAALRHTAWMIIAHSSFDLARYPEAELAYAEVLTLTDEQDEERQLVVDNLAASIYKQGEQARLLEDFAGAADHFLRIKTAAPTSEIRAAAEYDAAAALIHLQDWMAAAEVLDDFRAAHPEHELRPEATKQLAVVYEKAGELSRSAAEYELVADDAEDPEMRREAILVAGNLYEQVLEVGEVLRVYGQYIEEFPQPLNAALEIRSKVADLHEQQGDEDEYLEQLRAIVRIDGEAGKERTDRSRFLAARSSLVLTRPLFSEFTALALVQPFEESLAEKQRRMNSVLEAFEALVSYEVGEVTAAATFYIAKIYGHFSGALLESERPAGLSDSDLTAYELVIEEEAFPFEERAIEVHQENVELMRVGMFNNWIQRSLDELAVLVPGRYAKHEISSGFLGSIDRYAYRSPISPAPQLLETEEAKMSSVNEAPTTVIDIALANAEDVLPPSGALAGFDDVTKRL